MLVLSRRKDERFTIDTSDGPIRFVIVETRENKCRIGIDAPKHCEILRDELLISLDKEVPATDGQ